MVLHLCDIPEGRYTEQDTEVTKPETNSSCFIYLKLQFIERPAFLLSSHTLPDPPEN